MHILYDLLSVSTSALQCTRQQAPKRLVSSFLAMPTRPRSVLSTTCGPGAQGLQSTEAQVTHWQAALPI